MSDAFVETTLDWAQKCLAAGLTKASAGSLAAALARAAATAGGSSAGYAASVASGLVASVAVGTIAGDLLFNTSGTYDEVKTAGYCARCADQFDRVVSHFGE